MENPSLKQRSYLYYKEKRASSQRESARLRPFPAPWLLLAALIVWATDTGGLFPAFALAAAVHEGGHLLALLALGARLRGFSADGPGLNLRYGRTLSYRRDALAALAGPAANFGAGFLCARLAFLGILPARAYLFCGSCFALGLFNLFPAFPLDGAGALYALLCLRLPPARALRIVRACTFAVGAILCALGLYIFLKSRYNISMLAQGCGILGGYYAQGTGKSAAEGAEARALCRRRIRPDQKGPG